MFTVQPLSQQDPQWKNQDLGDDVITIGKFGCLLTCMAMVADGFGADENPATLNRKMKAVGGFIGALVIPAALPNAVPGVRFIKYVPCEGQPAPLADIDATLQAGKPVIVEVDYSPAKGLQNHWVVVYAKQGDDYLIQDPWPYPPETKQVLLTQRYGFAGDPGQIIQSAVWFDGTAQPPRPKPEPVALEDTGFSVYAAADDLALRQEPFVSDGNLIRRLPSGFQFYVKEPADRAKGKVGVINQWLNVQDAEQGYVGYVAAWYVSTSAQPAPEPAPAPSPTPQPSPAPQPVGSQIILYAAEDGLALRSQPAVADVTLIKRLPLNAELTVLEPEAQARLKLGVQGQWIKVQDIEGSQGFCAGWYLSDKRQDSALGVAVTPPEKANLVLRTIEDGVALRSQPVISDATLIKREPLNAELLVIEPLAQAEQKVGVVSQWIQVRDSAGVQGYVAAWYVIKRPAVAGT